MNYDLVGVSHHSGSLSFGHYTATCKNPLDDKWYDYNDSHVSLVQENSEIVNSSAYVLYYKRRDFFPDNNFDFEAIK